MKYVLYTKCLYEGVLKRNRTYFSYLIIEQKPSIPLKVLSTGTNILV